MTDFNWKEAIIGKSKKGKAVMIAFALILALTLIFGLKRCSEDPNPFPILGNAGGSYRLIQPAEEPSEENDYVGRVAAYEKEGDDTRWIQTALGHFVDTHQPLDE